MELVELAARPLVLVARFLLWLVWDLLLLSVAWGIGWPIWRMLSLGRFPHVGFWQFQESGEGEAFLVCGVGVVFLVAMIWLLSRFIGL